jgi:hypothetical protein
MTFALLALAAAVPPLGTIYLVRRRPHDRRPSSYARDRHQRISRIRQNLEQLGASGSAVVPAPAPTRSTKGDHRMRDLVVLPTKSGFYAG